MNLCIVCVLWKKKQGFLEELCRDRKFPKALKTVHFSDFGEKNKYGLI